MTPTAGAAGVRPLKLAVVLQTAPDPHSAVFIAYAALTEELGASGHTVQVITPGDFATIRRIGWRWVPLVYPFVVAAWVHRHRREFDLFVFHSYAGWVASLLRPGRAAPSVVAFHGLEPIFHRELLAEAAARGERLSWRYRALQEWLMPLMLRASCRRAAAVVCLNSDERALLVEKRWAEPEAIHVIPHGVAPLFFAPPRRVEAVRRLLFVGQWNPTKGTRYLVQAMADVMGRDPGLHLVCAGTARDAATVLGDFPESIRPRITVHPRLDHAHLSVLYREADAFVFPSLSEGFSRAIVEAMAGGLPIVATPIAGDVLHDKVNALIVPRRDPAALVAAVEQLTHDPALATRLSAAAARSAEQLHAADRLRELAALMIRVAGTSTVS